MPHERAEVSVLEVLRQQLAGELIRLVNRELRAILGPRHDVVASRVVHHVVPASERGWGQSPERLRVKKTAPSVPQHRRYCLIRSIYTRARTLYAGRAAPTRALWAPSRPGVRLSPSRTPLGRRRASRGALCAGTGVVARRIANLRERTTNWKFPKNFPEKCFPQASQLATWPR